MRFIENVSQETISMLQRIYKQSQHHRVRQRAHCILLSFQRHTTTELLDIFQVNRITLYHWFNAWESRGLPGLYDQAKQGRPPKCTPEQKTKIREWAKAYPKNLNKISSLVAEHFDVRISKSTLKRLLKATAFSWRRIRKGLKGEPDPEEYQQKKQALHALQQQASQGTFDLYYFDESGFCLTPYLPYAWQEKGQTIVFESGTSKRLNVLGFLSKNNECQAYSRLGSVDSHVVVRCINDFCKDLDKKTILVMDNAPIHTSKTFKDNISLWKEKDLAWIFHKLALYQCREWGQLLGGQT
ncbi:MAG: IS630 family transposase [Candidatus Tectimicrobiota bacterium]